MSYNGFTIVPQTVDLCVWDNKSGMFLTTGKRTVYKIMDSASLLIYGMKRTVASAKKAIDTNGQRWLRNTAPVHQPPTRPGS